MRVIKEKMCHDRRLTRSPKALGFLQKRRKEHAGEENHGAPIKMTDRTQICCNDMPDNELCGTESQILRLDIPYLVVSKVITTIYRCFCRPGFRRDGQFRQFRRGAVSAPIIGTISVRKGFLATPGIFPA